MSGITNALKKIYEILKGIKTAIEGIGTVDDADDGWKKVSNTWAYASASTITVPAGATTKYQKGDRIKLVQLDTVKYFVLTAVADSLLTILVNTDYVLANETITNTRYSHELNPVGFPDWFTCAAPTWSMINSIDDGSGNQPANHISFEQRIVGNTLYGRLLTGECLKSTTGTYGKFTPPVAITESNRTCIGTSYIREGGTDYVGVTMVYSNLLYFTVHASIPDNTTLATVAMDYNYEF